MYHTPREEKASEDKRKSYSVYLKQMLQNDTEAIWLYT